MEVADPFRMVNAGAAEVRIPTSTHHVHAFELIPKTVACGGHIAGRATHVPTTRTCHRRHLSNVALYRESLRGLRGIVIGNPDAEKHLRADVFVSNQFRNQVGKRHPSPADCLFE